MKLLKPIYGCQDYHRISIVCNDGIKTKSVSVHRMVAKHFIYNDDPINKIKVDHIDENKINNVYTNLRWSTSSQNFRYWFENHKHEYENPILQYDKYGNFIKTVKISCIFTKVY